MTVDEIPEIASRERLEIKIREEKTDQSEVFRMRMTSAIASGLKSDSKLGELDDQCVMVF
jgi:hypothetical protein